MTEFPLYEGILENLKNKKLHQHGHFKTMESDLRKILKVPCSSYLNKSKQENFI